MTKPTDSDNLADIATQLESLHNSVLEIIGLLKKIISEIRQK